MRYRNPQLMGKEWRYPPPLTSGASPSMLRVATPTAPTRATPRLALTGKLVRCLNWILKGTGWRLAAHRGPAGAALRLMGTRYIPQGLFVTTVGLPSRIGNWTFSFTKLTARKEAGRGSQKSARGQR